MRKKNAFWRKPEGRLKITQGQEKRKTVRVEKVEEIIKYTFKRNLCVKE